MTDILERLLNFSLGSSGAMRMDAAAEIEYLRFEIERLRNVAQPALIDLLKNKADEQTTALDQIMTTAADNLAAPGSDLKMTLEFIQHVAEHTLALTSAQCGGK